MGVPIAMRTPAPLINLVMPMTSRLFFGFVLSAFLLLAPDSMRGQFPLTKIADTSTPIPNGSGNITGFTPLYGPATSQGSVAFYATGAGGQKGYYIQTNGVLFRAVDTNTPAPLGGNFTGISQYAYGFESDSLFFGGSAAGQNGVFVYSNGVVTKLVDTNTVVPGTTSKFNGSALLYPFDGSVAFQGLIGSAQVGIYRYHAGVVTKVADTNDNYIGGSGKLSFTFSSAEISHDADGAVAFFTSDAAGGGRQGIFSVVNNTLYRIASTDTTVPGRAIPFGGSNPIFNRKPDISGGKIVFGGRFSGGSGIYQANLDGSGAVMLVDTTTQIPGTAFNFSSFQEIAIELGTVVFTAQGPGIWGAYRIQNGTLEKIIAKPDVLDGKGIDQVILSNQGLSGGRVALQITFTNGSSGIYSTVVGYANQSPVGGTLVPGSVVYSGAAGFSFQFVGDVGRAYRIQYNTNLATTNWITLTNFTYTTPLTITDAGPLTNPGRVYRAITP
jgi:hypothetical protein